jgi:hypothetical protein
MEIEDKPSKIKKQESVVLRETSKNRNVHISSLNIPY